MQVKYLDLQKQFAESNVKEVVNQVFQDCQFILGPQVEKFEKEFASFCDVPYALGVGSGTDALWLSLKALGIGPGDEVITAPNSFIATVGAIVAVGATPVFVDVLDDLNINPDLIEDAITHKTKAIIPVHLTGNPAQMDRIMEIAKEHRLHVIEDAAQAADATFKGKRVGSFGIGCFSLHPLKNLNVCGDGGMVTTSDFSIYEKIKQLRNHGLINRNESVEFGYCSRLDNLQAAIASMGLKNLRPVSEKRIQNAYYYNDQFRGLPIRTPEINVNSRSVFHTYIIQTMDRDDLQSYLTQKGVETKIHYPIPIHKQLAYWKYKKKSDVYPKCENQAKTILSLPIHQYLTEADLKYVVSTVKTFFDKEKPYREAIEGML